MAQIAFAVRPRVGEAAWSHGHTTNGDDAARVLRKARAAGSEGADLSDIPAAVDAGALEAVSGLTERERRARIEREEEDRRIAEEAVEEARRAFEAERERAGLRSEALRP